MSELDPMVNEGSQATAEPEQGVGSSSWKSSLKSDYANSPLVKNYDDTADGFNKMVDAHLNLEKMLGQDKVPIPKGADDTEGWARFSKAMGIPDKAESYGLPDPVDLPESMQNMGFDKGKFAEVAHQFKLTPDQAKGLWETYISETKNSYMGFMKTRQEQMTEMVNRMKGEWGDAYDTNVELGQTVINKFADNDDMKEWLTATMTQDPNGVKFLAKIGNQFAENKIGDFKYSKFSLSPQEAQVEIDQIMNDPNHPYNNEKVSDREHEAAIDYVNRLYKTIANAKG